MAHLNIYAFYAFWWHKYGEVFVNLAFYLNVYVLIKESVECKYVIKITIVYTSSVVCYLRWE